MKVGTGPRANCQHPRRAKDLTRGDVLDGLGRMGRGLLETVAGGVGTLFQTAGRLLGRLFGG